MTEIIVSANKSINLKKSENSYYGESLADIFKLLIPYHINGILAENADISFCFATPAGNLEKISLNDYGFVATRLRSYLTFYFRPNNIFYNSIGKVKCWIEFKKGEILIKSDFCEIEIHKHFYNKLQEEVIKWI